MKIVINKCYGGFSLSKSALKEYNKRTEKKIGYCGDIERNDPVLVEIVEAFGDKRSSGDFADLHIVEIPDGVDWEISECDGVEWVAEKHRTWG